MKKILLITLMSLTLFSCSVDSPTVTEQETVFANKGERETLTDVNEVENAEMLERYIQERTTSERKVKLTVECNRFNPNSERTEGFGRDSTGQLYYYESYTNWRGEKVSYGYKWHGEGGCDASFPRK